MFLFLNLLLVDLCCVCRCLVGVYLCICVCPDCRLCGELVCRSCTTKVYLPAQFEPKGKDISRVCHACLFGILVRRVTLGNEAANKQLMTRVRIYVWGNTLPPTQAEKEKLLPRVFYTPEWENVHDSATCFKCQTRTDKRHRQLQLQRHTQATAAQQHGARAVPSLFLLVFACLWCPNFRLSSVWDPVLRRLQSEGGRRSSELRQEEQGGWQARVRLLPLLPGERVALPAPRRDQGRSTRVRHQSGTQHRAARI